MSLRLISRGVCARRAYASCEAMRLPARVLLLALRARPAPRRRGVRTRRAAARRQRVATTRSEQPLGTFTFVGGGDIALTGDADAHVFDGIRGYLRAGDLVVGNLEGTLTTSGASKCSGGDGCFAFRGSPAWAGVLRRAGFNVLNVANNHALDYGVEGQSETLTSLRDAGLLEQGLPGQVLHVSLRGMRIALIGCAPVRLGAEPARHRRNSAPRPERSARRGRRHRLHARGRGGLGRRPRRGRGRDLSRRVAREQPGVRARDDPRRRRSRVRLRTARRCAVSSGTATALIAYSLGNLAGTHTLSTAGSLGSSALLRATLDARGNFLAASSCRYVSPAPARPCRSAGAGVVTRIRALSYADFGARAIRISAAGRLAAPDHTHLWSTSFSR